MTLQEELEALSWVWETPEAVFRETLREWAANGMDRVSGTGSPVDGAASYREPSVSV